MRRELPRRLQQFDVEIEESVAYFEHPPDLSIIHQLEDLADEAPTDPHEGPLPTGRRHSNKRSTLEEMQMKSISPKSKFRHQYAHEEAEKQIERLIGERTRAKIEMRERERTGWLTSTSPRHYELAQNRHRDTEVGSKKSPLLERPYMEAHRDRDNFAIKVKADHNRSSIIKNKDIIQNLLTKSCGFCGEPASEVFRDALVCCNARCRS